MSKEMCERFGSEGRSDSISSEQACKTTGRVALTPRSFTTTTVLSKIIRLNNLCRFLRIKYLNVLLLVFEAGKIYKFNSVSLLCF